MEVEFRIEVNTGDIALGIGLGIYLWNYFPFLILQ